MLYMCISQHIIVVAMQHPPQHLSVYLVLPIHLRVLVDPEKLNHVETRFGFVEGNRKNVQSLVVVFSGEDGQISVEDLDDELRNIGGLPLLLLRFLNQQGQDSIEGLDQLHRIKHHLFGFLLRRGLSLLVRFEGCGLTLRLQLVSEGIYTFCAFRHQ